MSDLKKSICFYQSIGFKIKFIEGSWVECSSEELAENLTCAKIAQVQTEGKRRVTRHIDYYNLDMIISVGYRVKSQRGTQFRIWANTILKDYLIKGYAINNKVSVQRYDELKQLVQVLGRTVRNQEMLQGDEAMNLINVVSDYAYALDTLDKYDYQKLDIGEITSENKFLATYENALQTISQLKEQFGESPLFGNEKDLMLFTIFTCSLTMNSIST